MDQDAGEGKALSQGWEIRATVNGRTVSWSFDNSRDARAVWRYINRKRETFDTGEPVTEATVSMPNGYAYSLGKIGFSWK